MGHMHQAVQVCTVSTGSPWCCRDLDRAWEAVRLAKRPRVHTFLATSPIHMEYKLKMTPDEACALLAQGIQLAAVFNTRHAAPHSAVIKGKHLAKQTPRA